MIHAKNGLPIPEGDDPGSVALRTLVNELELLPDGTLFNPNGLPDEFFDVLENMRKLHRWTPGDPFEGWEDLPECPAPPK
jgi:hypothetical protein